MINPLMIGSAVHNYTLRTGRTPDVIYVGEAEVLAMRRDSRDFLLYPAPEADCWVWNGLEVVEVQRPHYFALGEKSL